jgi:hypothetical protein
LNLNDRKRSVRGGTSVGGCRCKGGAQIVIRSVWVCILLSGGTDIDWIDLNCSNHALDRILALDLQALKTDYNPTKN